MLFRPVYIRSEPMRLETPIPMVRPPTPVQEPTPPPLPPPTPSPPVEQVEDEDSEEPEAEPSLTWRMPLLICGKGVATVYPKEATRDVLAGRMDYVLVDESGVTLLPKKHIFTVLKLTRRQKGLYEDYPCVGAHQRLLERRSTKLELEYQRRYL